MLRKFFGLPYLGLLWAEDQELCHPPKKAQSSVSFVKIGQGCPIDVGWEVLRLDCLDLDLRRSGTPGSATRLHENG